MTDNLAPVHTLSALCLRSRDISLEKGWLNPDGSDPRPFHTVIGLFHTELSEGFEDARKNRGVNERYYEVTYHGGETDVLSPEQLSRVDLETVKKAKPCGIPIELADFIIRVCQWAGSVGGVAGNNVVGSALEGVVASLRAETAEERVVADDIELLITQLHADVSFAFVVASGGLKGTGLPEKPLHYLATAVLTAFDFCQKHDVDLWAAIDEKEAFNRGRDFKHGGKKH